MSLAIKKKKQLPKYWLGGIFGQAGQGAAAGGGGFMGMLGQGVGQAGNQVGNPVQQQSMNQGFMKTQADGQKIGQGVEQVVGSLGPIGMAISGASKLAGKAFGANQFGQHRSTTNQFLDNSLNMKAGAAKLNTNVKNLFSGSIKGDEIADQLSLGLFGKSRAEKEGEKMKKYLNWKGANDGGLQSSVSSNLARIPGATAPAYGRKGMKLTTKYSKNC